MKNQQLAYYGGIPEVSIPMPHFIWPIYDKRHEAAILSVLKKGELNEYEEDSGVIFELENKISKYYDNNYCLLNNSGTSSLFSAFFALGLKHNDEVIVPNFTFINTVSPLLFFGVKLKFVDCDTITGNIDINNLRKIISNKTKLLVITHNWGIPNDMDSIMKLKNEYGFFLIEDCARALGSEYKGKKVGTFGDIGCFSLGEKKILSGGEGGFNITKQQYLFEKMTYLGHYFKCRSDVHTKLEHLKQYRETSLGLNFSISPFTASIANVNFDLLNGNISSRLQSYFFLKEKFKEYGIRSVSLIEYPIYSNIVSIYHFVLTYNPDFVNTLSKELFVDILKKENVDIRITDNKPLLDFKLFQQEGLNFYPNSIDIDTTNIIINSHKYYKNLLLMPAISDINILLQYVHAIRKVEDYLLTKKH